MPQGNFWGQKVAISAIQALSSLDYVGIVEFNWGMGGGNQGGNINGASWAFDMQPAGDKSAAISAAKKMVVGDMPDFGASMQLAFNGLTSVRAGQRHAIVISDGDPAPPSQALLDQYKAQKITITTIMVGGHGTATDKASMQYVAMQTGGRFYNITNPKQLPQIFIKEAKVVSRSLIQEGDAYQPRLTSRLPGPLEGFGAVPQIHGYVLTAAKDGLTQIALVNDTSEGPDPIYAYWNYGLGKSVAYTSDLTGRWGTPWVTWEQFRAFWEQSTRWVMRPSSPANLLVNTRQEGERSIVELEALEANAAFLNFLQTSAVVLKPDNTAEPLVLQQVGPGRYRGEFKTSEAGAYLINVSYSSGAAGEAAAKGNLQAAVTVPYSREFKDVKHNRALLADLAARTGGRVLSATDPSLVELFDQTDLEVPKSPKEIWDLLAIIAAGLFLMDVAARRVSIDPKLVAALAGRAVGKRTDASTDTVAAWKRTKNQSSQTKLVVKVKPDAADRRVRFEADERDRNLSIDVSTDVPADARVKPVSAPKPTVKPPVMEEGDYTARLLAAKRRARGDDDKSENAEEKPRG